MSIWAFSQGSTYQFQRSRLSAAWGDLDAKACEALLVSLKVFGQRESIIAMPALDSKGPCQVLDGWHRLMALSALGMDAWITWAVDNNMQPDLAKGSRLFEDSAWLSGDGRSYITRECGVATAITRNAFRRGAVYGHEMLDLWGRLGDPEKLEEYLADRMEGVRGRRDPHPYEGADLHGVMQEALERQSEIWSHGIEATAMRRRIKVLEAALKDESQRLADVTSSLKWIMEHLEKRPKEKGELP